MMNSIIKALVLKGQYSGQIVRISNVSVDEIGRQKAACTLSDGKRVNISVNDLEMIQDTPEVLPSANRPKVSMPFVSGSSSSRTLTHTKNMGKNRVEKKSHVPSTKIQLAKCESCGSEYNVEDRKGMPGKISDCDACAEETVNKLI